MKWSHRGSLVPPLSQRPSNHLPQRMLISPEPSANLRRVVSSRNHSRTWLDCMPWPNKAKLRYLLLRPPGPLAHDLEAPGIFLQRVIVPLLALGIRRLAVLFSGSPIGI